MTTERILTGKVLRVYRTMEQARDGKPRLCRSWKCLGVRPGVGRRTDIPVQDGNVAPGTGGTSVTPADPFRALPDLPWMIPSWAGGEGDYPVWALDLASIPPDLCFRPDPDKRERHGYIEPARIMRIEEYEQLITDTRGLWQRVL